MPKPENSKNQSEKSVQSLDTLIFVEVSKDGFTAKATVLSQDKESQITVEEIITSLKSQKIIYGVREEGIKNLIFSIKSGTRKKGVIVAQGEPVVQGKKQTVVYKFRTQLEAGKIEKEKIDFKERGLVNNVQPGQVLVTIFPETASTSQPII